MIVGKNYYYYSKGLGVIKLRYKKEDSTHFIFKEIGSTFAYDFRVEKKLIHLVFDSKDIAQINYLKETIESTHGNIDHHETKLNKYNNMLLDLNEKIDKLKEKYPEEFI